MRAAIWTRYGPPDVLEVQEVPTPEPKPGEVRIRVEATTVTSGDCEMCALRFPWYFALPMRIFVGWRHPKRVKSLGQELAGTIDAVGEGVTKFKAGDKVFAATGMKLGGQAEYAILPESPEDGMLAPRPASLTAEEAAAVPFAAFEARHFLAKAAIRPGEKILIIGAGGSIGTYGVQIAKASGAEVTAVERPAKHAMLKEIGADHVLDADAESYGPRRRRGAATAIAANDDRADAGFDVAFDVVGPRTFSRAVGALRRGGRYVSANPSFTMMMRGLWVRLIAGKRVIFGTAKHTPEALSEIGELIETQRLKPIIGRTFALDDIAAAYRYAGSGEKTGNVVVRLG
jgi:NADPH:quinone reductase-like Zn-dependent oxidoreductase